MVLNKSFLDVVFLSLDGAFASSEVVGLESSEVVMNLFRDQSFVSQLQTTILSGHASEEDLNKIISRRRQHIRPAA